MDRPPTAARLQDGMKKPAARSSAAPNPATKAVERLAKLAMAGTQPLRMVAAMQGTLAEWGREALMPGDLRERMETLLADLDLGIAAAEDYVGEADTEQGRAAARGQVEALLATREALAGGDRGALGSGAAVVRLMAAEPGLQAVQTDGRRALKTAACDTCFRIVAGA